QTSTSTPAFNGRTYANFELNNAAANITVTGGSAVSIDNLTITAGTLNFNMTATPGHSIKGNISVAGTLNFAPASAGTVNLNGGSAQTISGAGTLTINSANQTVVINNSNGISLSRDLTLDLGTLTFTSGHVTTGSNTLIFNYLDPPDVPVSANENNFVIFKYNGAFTMPGGTVDTVNNQATISGVTSFSDWTLAEPGAPTAADGSVTGRIVDTDGIPISGVGIRLGGTQSRLTITDALGNYHFDNVETNGFYTVMPTRANYRFSPEAQSFSALGHHIDAAFNGIYTDEHANPLDTTEY